MKKSKNEIFKKPRGLLSLSAALSIFKNFEWKAKFPRCDQTMSHAQEPISHYYAK